MVKKRKQNKIKATPPVEEQGRNKRWGKILFNAIMAIVNILSLYVGIHSCENNNPSIIQTEKISKIKTDIKSCSDDISTVFSNKTPLDIFQTKEDDSLFVCFQLNVKLMMNHWKSYENIDTPSDSIKVNIVLLKDQIKMRKQFDYSVNNVINAIKDLYHSNFLIENKNDFPDKERVQKSLTVQEIWLKSDSID